MSATSFQDNDQGHTDSPPAQQQNTFASHPTSPRATVGTSFPFYPGQQHDHPTDGAPLQDESESQPSHPHPTPADMLAASAQLPPGTFPPPPVAFPPGVPVAYFATAHGGIIAIPQVKHKRRQVKNACTNCQKACKKCDEERPCSRCVKYGIEKECVDSQRKERKKGVKRGPYKKRDPKAQMDAAEEALMTPDTATLQAMAAAGGVAIYPYAPGATILAQGIKGPDGTFTYPPQYYIAPPAMTPTEPAGEASTSAPASHPQHYPYYTQMVTPYGQQYPPGYIIPQGAGPSGHVPPPDGSSHPGAAGPSSLYSLSSNQHDDPIERQKQPTYPIGVPQGDGTAPSVSQDDEPVEKSKTTVSATKSSRGDKADGQRSATNLLESPK